MRRFFRLVLVLACAWACFSQELGASDTLGPQRSLLQSTNEITVKNQKQLTDAFENLKANSTIVLSFNKLRLAENVTINAENVTIRGTSLEKRPVVRCPETGSAIIITANGTTVRDMIFEGCRNGSAMVIDSRGVTTDITVKPAPFITAQLENLIFRDNGLTSTGIRSRGGAVAIGVNGIVNIFNSQFFKNKAGQGGAIFAARSQLNFDRCDFKENTGPNGGGGIFVDGFEGQGLDTGSGTLFKGSLTVTNSMFEENKVTEGNEGREPFAQGGRPLEPFQYYEFKYAGSTGGAILAKDVVPFTVENCVFKKNGAVAGGAISGLVTTLAIGSDETTNEFFQLISSTFTENEAKIINQDSFQTPDDDLRQGGALFLSITDGRVQVNLDNCLFENNSAVYGGAVDVVTADNTRGTVNRCSFDGNVAVKAGGAVVLRNVGTFTWKQSNITRSKAEVGGGILLTNNAFMTIEGPSLEPSGNKTGNRNSRFEDNRAVDGGAILCAFCGSVVLQGPEFYNNNASRNGGGVSILDGISEFILQESIFENNRALRGGGVYMDTASSFGLRSSQPDVFPNKFIKNTAVSGGALYVLARSLRRNDILVSDTKFMENEARADTAFLNLLEGIGEDVTPATGGSRRLLQDIVPLVRNESFAETVGSCRAGGGGGLCLALDRIPETAIADVQLVKVEFEENKADVGGGMYVAVENREWGVEDCPNTPSPTAHPCRSLRMHKANFTDNIAVKGGGGVFITEPGSISVTCNSFFSIATEDEWSRLDDVIKVIMDKANATEEDRKCIEFDGNRVLEGEGVFGPDVATRAVSVVLVFPTFPITNQTSGSKLLDGLSADKIGLLLEVKDAFNQTVTGGIPESEVDVSVESSGINGQQVYKAANGTVTVNDTAALGAPIEHNLTFTAEGLIPAVTTLNIRECFPGEEQFPVTDERKIFTCSVCDKDLYTFQPDVQCRECEKHAHCSGGASLVPKDGFWHSTPFSPQFHECIVREACTYEGRREELEGYFAVLSGLEPSNAVVPNEIYKQCSEGYRGILCGSCMPGYGHFPGGECVKCTSGKGVTVLVIILMALWSFLLISAEILNAATTNRELLGVIGNGKKPQSPPRPVAEMLVAEAQGRGVPGGTRGYCANPEPGIPVHVEAAENLTETIKIFINYLQVTSVAVAINVKWLAGIEILLQIQEILAGISNGSSKVPLDCTLDDDSTVPKSVRALWIRVLFPVMLLLTFLALSVLFWFLLLVKQKKNPPRDTRDAINVSTLKTMGYIVVITTIFFAYHNVTEELMRTVNCSDVDEIDAGEDPFGNFTAAMGGQVWAEDTALECFQGKHMTTAVMGILFLFCFSFGFIIFIPLLTHRNKDKLTTNRTFIARFGFLYRAYRTEYYTVWWEAVITLRKALISAVVVYAYPLGPNLQALLGLGVLIVAQVFHLLFRPFRRFDSPTCSGWVSKIPMTDLVGLNHLEAFSLFVSTCTFYSGTIFNDNNASDEGKWTLAVFVLVTNIAFLVYMVLRIFGALVAVCDTKLDSREVPYEKRWLLPKKFWLLAKSYVQRNRMPHQNQEEMWMRRMSHANV